MCHFVCTVTDFYAAEKDSGVKLCTRVRLLSGHVFAHCGELWLAGSHGGGNASGMYAATCLARGTCTRKPPWGYAIGGRGSVGHSELSHAAMSFAFAENTANSYELQKVPCTK